MNQEIEILLELLQEANELNQSDIYERDRVVEKTQALIRRVFGQGSDYLQLVGTRNFQSRGSYWSNPFKAKQMAFESGRSQLIEALQSMVLALDPSHEFEEAQEPERGGEVIEDPQIFVLHGPEDEMKEEIVETLTVLDLPFMTVEGIEDLRLLSDQISEVSAHDAVILLLTKRDLEAIDEAENRDFGKEVEYLLENLATKHMVVVYQEADGLEFHLEFSPISYVPFDAEGQWKFLFVSELEAANFQIDLNKLPD